MKYINAGYINGVLVSYRNDFKAIKLGNEKVFLCKSLQDELKTTLADDKRDKLTYCIRILNEQRCIDWWAKRHSIGS